jgi:hypothetical protein
MFLYTRTTVVSHALLLCVLLILLVVYRAYSKFSFRDLAAFAAEQRATQRVQVAPFHQTAPEPAAVKAAIFGKSGSKQAKPAAVEDTAYLYPTSIDQQGRGRQRRTSGLIASRHWL